MVSAVIGFAIGLIVGAVAAIIAGIAILNRPPPPRERPIFSAIGAGRARTTGPEDVFEAIDRRLR
jgi:hypothetical protein